MNLLIYDENILAKGIIEGGFQDGIFNWEDALLVAKHYRHIDGNKDARIKTRLINFIQSKDPSFNYVRNRNIISKLIKSSKMGFFSTGSVSIGEIEISEIRKIRNFKQQKISIAALFLSKRETNGGYINIKDWKNIKLIVSRKVASSDIQSVFSLFHSRGLCQPVGASQKLTFGEDAGKTVIFIDNDLNARYLIDQYIRYCGGEIGFCRRCDDEYIKSHSRQILCSSCGEASRLNKYKKYNLKRARNE